MNTSLSISVVIPSRNRAHLLGNLLEALHTQSLPIRFWEVIVVNNASNDGTEELLKKWKVRLTQLRCLKEPQAGSNFARNTGIRAASGTLLAFLDDDALPHPQWLERIYQRYSILSVKTDCLGGRVALSLPESLPRWYGPFLEHYLSHTHPSASFTPITARTLCSANLVIPATLLKSFGGFDERLNRKTSNLRSNDETLTLLKLEASGAQFFYDPTIRVFHQIEAERLKPSYFRRRAWWQGRSDSEMEYYLCGKKLLWGNVIWPSLHYLLTHPSLVYFAFRPCRGPNKFNLALQGQLFLGRVWGGFLQLVHIGNRLLEKHG